MKKISSIILFVFMTFLANAQVEKTSIGILSIRDNTDNSSEEINIITEELTNSFVKTKRFVMVDRSQMDQLKREKELQKTEDFMDGSKYVEQGKNLGAQFLISSMLSTYSNDGEVCKFSLTLKVIDVESGQVIATEIINSKGGSKAGGIMNSLMGATTGYQVANIKDPEKALRKALKDISPNIDNFVDVNFPVVFALAEISQKDPSKGAKKVLISGGKDMGIEKGDKFKVVELSSMVVNGKTLQRKKEIGQLQVVNVEDENFSSCSVSSGGTDIATKFEAGVKIQVLSIIK